eukprot:GAHX01004329.1.p1 GENE.GAHX01004329.1~~GAHX01004329.1.p1  ORF type:complete len:102 (+),score=11.63 GAHX01004329.1:753-1058(+)
MAIINGLKAILSKYKDKRNKPDRSMSCTKLHLTRYQNLKWLKGKSLTASLRTDQQRPKSLKAISILFGLILKGNESTKVARCLQDLLERATQCGKCLNQSL